jgi:DNA-binding transcriptional LysR family regulator
MRLEQLRQFIAVAQKGNFRKASRELNISQPALSRSIQSLEQHFNVPLFDRLPGGVALTEYGHLVLDWAKETLSTSTNLLRHVELLENISTGMLVIATGPYFADSFLASAIAGVINRHPSIHIKVVRDVWKNAERMLVNREVDLFLGWIDEPVMSTNLKTITLISDTLVLFCRENHPIMEKMAPKFEDILKFPFAAPMLPEALLNAIDRSTDKYSVVRKPFVSVEFDTYSELRKIVEMSDCIGGLPENCIIPHLDKGSLKRIPVSIPGAGGSLGVSFLKGTTMLPGTKLIINELTKAVEARDQQVRSMSDI